MAEFQQRWWLSAIHLATVTWENLSVLDSVRSNGLPCADYQIAQEPTPEVRRKDMHKVTQTVYPQHKRRDAPSYANKNRRQKTYRGLGSENCPFCQYWIDYRMCIVLTGRLQGRSEPDFA